MSKAKTTYRLTKQLKIDMLQVMALTVGKKQKSKWINEAIGSFIKADPGLTTVGLGEDYETFDVTDDLVVDETTQNILEEAILKIRRQDPLYEGVKSAIIRASIKHKVYNQ